MNCQQNIGEWLSPEAMLRNALKDSFSINPMTDKVQGRLKVLTSIATDLITIDAMSTLKQNPQKSGQCHQGGDPIE